LRQFGFVLKELIVALRVPVITS